MRLCMRCRGGHRVHLLLITPADLLLTSPLLGSVPSDGLELSEQRQRE